MTHEEEARTRRADRLLRWYPRGWRARYGEEFAELLVAEMCECPHSWSRGADVAWSGLLARLTRIGLTDHALEPGEQIRTSLATLGCAFGVFLGFGVAIWSQLNIGWQWSAPDNGATYTAMMLMSVTMLLFTVMTVFAAAPVVSHVMERIIRHRAHGLVRPSLLVVASVVFLVVGSRHFGNSWPGTGGHVWAQQGLVPGGVAAFMWAATLSVTSYWAHPHALTAFPASEVVWMALSPVAVVCLMVGAVKTIRRAELSSRVLRYETGLARLASFVMVAFLVGSCSWVIEGGPGPRNLFHVGAIDAAGLVVMGLALVIAHRAADRARSGAFAQLRR